MSGEEVPVGRLIATIVTVLAAALLLSLAGLVALGLMGGDPGTRATLTHVIETVIGVFIGIAAGRLASDD
ncbi:MAG: hypothetical protein C0506_13350 [Anaerolinea sp.]|nr:hypothetical protein [Anaerolinea sp.]